MLWSNYQDGKTVIMDASDRVISDAECGDQVGMRIYALYEDGIQWTDVEAPNASVALDMALERFDASLYRGTSTRWVEIGAYSLDLDEAWRIIEVPPVIPPCREDQDHAWEEVSCRGNGGGVLITDECRICGLIRVTDTWAQDPSGRQGLTSVSYRQPMDAD